MVKETVTVERKYEKSGSMRDIAATVTRIDGGIGSIILTVRKAGDRGTWYIYLTGLDELAALRSLIDEILEAEKCVS